MAMTTKLAWIFLRGDGLRAGWRLLGHASLVSLFAILAVSALVGSVYFEFVTPGEWSVSDNLTLQAFLGFGVFWVAHALSGLLLDARLRGSSRGFGRLAGVGVGGPPLRSLAETFGGALLGAVLLFSALGVMAIGGIEVKASGLFDPLSWLWWTIVLYAAAATEELIFRGYGFQWFATSFARLARYVLHLFDVYAYDLDRWCLRLSYGALALLSSALFGVVHLTNPSANLISTINTALAGIWFAVLVYRTRTLTWAIGAHLGWNHAQALIVGTPLSGLDSDELGLSFPSLLSTSTRGAEWLSGGGYGPEGSIATTLAMLLAIGISAVLPRRPEPQSLRSLVLEPEESPGSEAWSSDEDSDLDAAAGCGPAAATWVGLDIASADSNVPGSSSPEGGELEE
ncbi:MAG: CPBP family intramembrane metalloprotease [Deltaproteobacteria bacterium]|nr:MAG: CPBP family intramembrane metalloprotease [Deltaproteobacteria bacterium]